MNAPISAGTSSRSAHGIGTAGAAGTMSPAAGLSAAGLDWLSHRSTARVSRTSSTHEPMTDISASATTAGLVVTNAGTRSSTIHAASNTPP
jgi:hypothetical protein